MTTLGPAPYPARARRDCRRADINGILVHDREVIAHLQKTVIECPDPRQLAEFYCSVLGMRVIGQDSDDWVVIGSAPNVRELAFQRVDPWVAPLWRDQVRGPRLHLDLWVADIDRAEQKVLALGARRAPGSPETGYRVFLDPVGHPFCLIFGPRQPTRPALHAPLTYKNANTWRRNLRHQRPVAAVP